MNMFGTYTFKYEPGRESEGEILPSIEISLSGEANLSEILRTFRDFLAASGYPVNFRDELELRAHAEVAS